ncbi:hypothetical protein [Aquimarina sp. MMG016]|uniref:toxin-antitoxin system YwqK family antitoxin n=1 Tax=Aquimarina sp. MMG016 TaxID=2822690 RepID=UPI001B3A6082|nr:hypothetical protein [Aquimarina sp. MMG016]MBQ4821386.1 hypothetical protein [Aquimarina sp. MMG016]
MKLFFTLIFVLGSSQYLGNDISRKIISDDTYNYTFYVSTKDKSDPKDYKEYFWFKTGKIHSSYGGVNGQLLHGEYKKTYRENGIAEQGEFHYGLKDNIWKSWYENGKIEKITNWQKGIATGIYREFTENGELLIRGKFKNSKKHGRWINYKSKDTLYFKKGQQVVKEEMPEEEKAEKANKKNKKSFGVKTKDFFKNLFKKKTPEEKQKIKQEKEAKKKQKELDKKRKELAKKQKELQKNKTSKKQ